MEKHLSPKLEWKEKNKKASESLEAVKGLCELLDKEIAINETNNIMDVSKVETLTQIYFLLWRKSGWSK